MKKKMFSLLMALVMIVSILPWDTAAVMLPMDEPGAAEEGETLLTEKTQFAKHPSHLPTGEISITQNIAPNAGQLSFTEVNAVCTGQVSLLGWEVSDDGVLTFSQSHGQDGDTITFTVTVSSLMYPPETLTVVVVFGYSKLIITNETSVVYGQTLRLTCIGTRGDGAVVYSVTNITGAATISGNILTPTPAPCLFPPHS